MSEEEKAEQIEKVEEVQIEEPKLKKLEPMTYWATGGLFFCSCLMAGVAFSEGLYLIAFFFPLFVGIQFLDIKMMRLQTEIINNQKEIIMNQDILLKADLELIESQAEAIRDQRDIIESIIGIKNLEIIN